MSFDKKTQKTNVNSHTKDTFNHLALRFGHGVFDEQGEINRALIISTESHMCCLDFLFSSLTVMKNNIR